MARERLRDWPQIAYQYYMRPMWSNSRKLPDPVWHEHTVMVDLWNNLVELGEKNREAYEQILEQIGKIKDLNAQVKTVKENMSILRDNLKKTNAKLRKQDKALTEDIRAKVAVKKMLLQDLYEEIKEEKEKYKEKIKPYLDALSKRFYEEINTLCQGSDVYWSNKEAIRDNFISAWGRYLKRQGEMPRKHFYSTASCHFHYRYTGGGIPISDFLNTGDSKNGEVKRLWVGTIPETYLYSLLPQRQVKKEARIPIKANIRGHVLTFSTIMHRPIPPEAILKSITLKRFYVARVPKWSVSFCVEVPESTYKIPSVNGKRTACAIDLGYRLVEQDGEKTLRVGYMQDMNEHEEEILLPAKIYSREEHCKELATKRDILLNHTKADIKGYYEINQTQEYLATVANEEEIKKLEELFTVNWHISRHKRISNIKKIFDEVDTGGYISTRIEEWLPIDYALYAERANLLHKNYGYKKWFYRNLAIDLCNKYHVITIEDWSLSDIQKKKEFPKEGDPQAIVNYHRQIASLYLFRESLNNRAKKTGTIIEKKDPEYTTMECNKCGHIFSPKHREKLIWDCPKCKAVYDQDQNAAKNLLAVKDL